MLGMEGAVPWMGLEKPRASMTNPTATLEGQAEQSHEAGLHRTSLAWVFQLRDGLGEAEAALHRGKDTNVQRTLRAHSVLV